jgi:hypothetical protein
MRYKSPSLAPAPAATIYETPDASKESLNLLTLVAELYNVGVVGPKLIYDLIREFIDHGLYETDVEGLLKIVKRESVLKQPADDRFWLAVALGGSCKSKGYHQSGRGKDKGTRHDVGPHRCTVLMPASEPSSCSRP